MAASDSRLKEPFCALSHLFGAALSVSGLVALLVAAHGRPRPIVAYCIYGFSLILLYTLSTVYHSLHVTPKQEKLLQRLDHVGIFLLIAGTYTPVCLITLHAGIGMRLLAAVWALATFGIFTIVLWKTHPHWIRVTLYVLMGWLAVVALPGLLAALGISGMLWMVAGGLAYTLGIFFYAMDDTRERPWMGKRTGHDIWHIFVLTGSVCHFVLIYWFVAR